MGTRIIFITGTDTGVGKTVATSLLLCHLRNIGAHTFALKPFCSGGRNDAQLLCDLQDGDLTLDEVNPFYFPEPVAPLISARKHKRNVPLEKVLKHIHSIASRLSLPLTSTNQRTGTENFLLIEGSGGLLVPLGEGYTMRDLIVRLACEVVIVSHNQLGTINHTLLTAQGLLNPAPPPAFRTPGVSALKSKPFGSRLTHIALMDSASRDPSCRSNAAILSELLDPIPLISVPFLGRNCESLSALKKNAKKIQKTLARFVL